MQSKNTRGFTLVELMITLAIIGILATIAIPVLNSLTLRAKTSEAKTNIGGMKTNLEAFYGEFNGYPVIPQTPTQTVPGTKSVWVDVDCPSSQNGNSGCTPRNLGECGSFSCIGYKPAGAVFYQYDVGVETNDYIIGASADLDEVNGAGQFGYKSSNDLGQNPQNNAGSQAAPACAGYIGTADLYGETHHCTPSVY